MLDHDAVEHWRARLRAVRPPCDRAGCRAVLRELAEQLGCTCGEGDEDHLVFAPDGLDALTLCRLSALVNVHGSMFLRLPDGTTWDDINAALDPLREWQRVDA